MLAVAMAGAALGVGAVHEVVLCAVGGVLIVAALLAASDFPRGGARPQATLLLVTAIALTVFTALQCVPMPSRLLVMLSPHAADVWSRVLVPLREAGPGWAPISLDPHATRVETLKGCMYLLSFLVALGVARNTRGRAFLGGAIVLVAVALAAAALLHPAFGAKRLYGVYEPGPGLFERHLAPLLNPNHLAAYLNLGFCISLAAAIASSAPAPRPLSAAIALLLAATQLWVASRGGVATMVLGAVLVMSLSRGARARLRQKGAWLTLVTGVAVVGATLTLVFAGADVKNELISGDVSKVQVGLEGVRLALLAPLVGVGRGSFETSFPYVHEGTGYPLITNPENLVAQWCSEWGFPLSIAAFVAVGVALRPSVRAYFSGATGAWAAVIVNGVHNLVDFSSEIPGVALSTVVCAAIVVSGSTHGKPRLWVERWTEHGRAITAVCSGACALMLAVAVLGLGRDVGADRQSLYQAAAVRPLGVAQMHEVARQAMLRHPAEPYLPFAVAFRAARFGGDEPLPWFDATLERARVYWPAHSVLGSVLARRYPAQSRLEYRIASEQCQAVVPALLLDAPRIVSKYEDAVELLPSSPELGNAVLQAIVPVLAPRLPATAHRLDDDLSKREPMLADPKLRAAQDAVADLEEPAAWCTDAARPGCLSRAVSLTREIESVSPGKCVGFALEARVLTADGRVDAALDLLQKASPSVEDQVVCLQTVFATANASGRRNRAMAALDAIVRAGCTDPQACVAQLSWVAEQQRGLGNLMGALTIYKRVRETAPGDEAVLTTLAALAGQAGLHGEALQYYRELAEQHPSEEKWTKAMDQERATVGREAAARRQP
jgi:tetratricopeptide (TPR) repeat protein